MVDRGTLASVYKSAMIPKHIFEIAQGPAENASLVHDYLEENGVHPRELCLLAHAKKASREELERLYPEDSARGRYIRTTAGRIVKTGKKLYLVTPCYAWSPEMWVADEDTTLQVVYLGARNPRGVAPTPTILGKEIEEAYYPAQARAWAQEWEEATAEARKKKSA